MRVDVFERTIFSSTRRPGRMAGSSYVPPYTYDEMKTIFMTMMEVRPAAVNGKDFLKILRRVRLPVFKMCCIRRLVAAAFSRAVMYPLSLVSCTQKLPHRTASGMQSCVSKRNTCRPHSRMCTALAAERCQPPRGITSGMFIPHYSRLSLPHSLPCCISVCRANSDFLMSAGKTCGMCPGSGYLSDGESLLLPFHGMGTPPAGGRRGRVCCRRG